MHRNTIRFGDTEPPRTITLVARGSMWPIAVEVDGEKWERTEQVVEVKGGSVRVYKHARWPRREAG